MKNAPNQSWDALCERAGGKSSLLAGGSFPDRKSEAWRYTPLQSSLGKKSWKEAPSLAGISIEKILEEFSFTKEEILEKDAFLFFANGQEISHYTKLSPKMQRIEISENSEENTPILKENFSSSLNYALRQKGLHLRIPEGSDGGCLVLLHYHEGDNISTHLHHVITLEKNAKLTILDLHMGHGAYLSNPMFEVHCAENAHLRHVKRQAESLEAAHLGFVSAMIAQKGDYESFTLNQGALLARHEVKTILNGRYANTHVNAVQLVDGARLNDLTSMIHHNAPDCTSRQTVRTVLDGEGHGVFQGKILVDQLAQKTDGYQMNQALLLSEKAQINSKPELEIYADDVKCSHGATVGALDEEQLFYLRSRGIDAVQARAMLVRAFLKEAVELLEDEELQEFLLKHLPQQFRIME